MIVKAADGDETLASLDSEAREGVWNAQRRRSHFAYSYEMRDEKDMLIIINDLCRTGIAHL